MPPSYPHTLSNMHAALTNLHSASFPRIQAIDSYPQSSRTDCLQGQVAMGEEAGQEAVVWRELKRKSRLLQRPSFCKRPIGIQASFAVMLTGRREDQDLEHGQSYL